MRYMLSLFGEEGGMEDASPEDMKAELDRWEAFGQEASRLACWFRATDCSRAPRPRRCGSSDRETRSCPTGHSWRPRSSSAAIYVLDCKDLDEALEWAARRSQLRSGSIEIRPVMDFDGVTATRTRCGQRRPRARPDADQRGGRPPVPARVGAGGGDLDPHPRRLRPRRGGGAGGLRGRSGALAARRAAGQSRRRGSCGPRATARSTACAASACTARSCVSWSA